MWSTVPADGQDSTLSEDPDHRQGTKGCFGAVPAPYQAGRNAAFLACDYL